MGAARADLDLERLAEVRRALLEDVERDSYFVVVERRDPYAPRRSETSRTSNETRSSAGHASSSTDASSRSFRADSFLLSYEEAWSDVNTPYLYLQSLRRAHAVVN